MSAYNELLHTNEMNSTMKLDPMYEFKSQNIAFLADGLLSPKRRANPSGRRTSSRQNRNSPRYKTMPITFREIVEVDEPTSDLAGPRPLTSVDQCRGRGGEAEGGEEVGQGDAEGKEDSVTCRHREKREMAEFSATVALDEASCRLQETAANKVKSSCVTPIDLPVTSVARRRKRVLNRTRQAELLKQRASICEEPSAEAMSAFAGVL